MSDERSICRAILVLSFLLVWNGCCESSGIPRNDFENRKRVSRDIARRALFFVGASVFVLLQEITVLVELFARCTIICAKMLLKKRKKKSKRDLETSRHPWLSILLIDHRYLPIITLMLVPIIIEDIPSAIVPVVENCRVSFGPSYLYVSMENE